MIDAIQVPEILLPRAGIDLTKWAVVACDQFTAQPEYWQAVEGIVGDAPSTLRLVYPEAYVLHGGEDLTLRIHAAMRAYLEGGVFAAPRRGFILTERTTKAGARIGLVLSIDLEQYDFAAGARSLIRPTEGTILDRIPPRVKVRMGAPLETPHIMLLADDPGRTLIEPVYAARDALPLLYDVALMQGGGRLRGWLVEETSPILQAAAQLPSLAGEDPILFAVGDGNHSLATARQCYLSGQKAARHALVEVVNLFDDSLVFEPIHRLIEGADRGALDRAAKAEGITLDGGDVRTVQPFLDRALPQGATLDYIHGDEALATLGARQGFIGLRMAPIAKETLFPSLLGGHVLPRKAFSMGEAEEKRYYMECRAL